MITEQINNKLTDVRTQEKSILDKITGINGPVATFVPSSGNPELQRAIEQSGQIPTGIFADCAIFDDDNEHSIDQARQRRVMPVTKYIVEMLGEVQSGDNIALRLLNENVKATYAQACIVEAAKQYKDGHASGELTGQQAEFLLRMIDSSQDELYPKVDSAIANYALDKIKGVETAGESLMSDEVRNACHQYLHDKYDPVFAGVYETFDQNDDSAFDEHPAEITREFMKQVGLPMTEDVDDNNAWKCIVDDNRTGFSVVAGKKRVMIGKRSKPLTKQRWEQLMMHEIVVHALSGENGARTGYHAFQTGLPGYVDKQEGVGLLVESLWSGEDPDKLSRDHFRYVAVSYASGAYDGVMHNEQETYDYVGALMSEAGFDDDDELYRHVMRTFRGMPPGARMRSNLSYLAGKTEMAQYIEGQYRNGQSIDDIFSLLLAAKIDPTNENHLNLLREAESSTLASA